MAERKAHPIFEKARELAAAIHPVPAKIPEDEAPRLAYRDFHPAFAEAVKQAVKDYVSYADDKLKPFGFNFASVATPVLKKAILAEVGGWKGLFGWDFPGLSPAEEAQLLEGWAEGTLNGCLKDLGR